MAKIKATALLTGLIGLLVISSSFAQESEHQKMVIMNTLDWSPDGKNLLFTAIMINEDFSDFSMEKWTLYQVKIDDRSISKLEDGVSSASYSPSGNQLAYGKFANNNWDIYLKTMSDAKVIRLTTHQETDNSPTWSPDGSKIAFNSERAGGKEIFIMNSDGSNLEQITHSAYDTVHSYNPQWSPTDDHIVYFRETGNHMDQIYLTDSKGSFFKNLTNNDKHNFYPTWASESDFIYTVGSESNQIYMIDKDGTETRPVVGLQGSFSKKSPVSEVIAAISEDSEGKKQIILFDIKTGKAELIVDQSKLMSLE